MFLIRLQGRSTDLPAVCHLLPTCGSQGQGKQLMAFHLCRWNSNDFTGGATLFVQPSHTSVSVRASLICSEIPRDAGGNVNVRVQLDDMQIAAPSERLKCSSNSVPAASPALKLDSHKPGRTLHQAGRRRHVLHACGGLSPWFDAISHPRDNLAARVCL